MGASYERPQRSAGHEVDDDADHCTQGICDHVVDRREPRGKEDGLRDLDPD